MVFAHDFDLLSNYQRLASVLAALGCSKYFSSAMMPTNEEKILSSARKRNIECYCSTISSLFAIECPFWLHWQGDHFVGGKLIRFSFVQPFLRLPSACCEAGGKTSAVTAFISVGVNKPSVTASPSLHWRSFNASPSQSQRRT